MHTTRTVRSVRLPTFLVIGAYKSGTTTLHHCLRAHPEVYVPRRKEPNYFAFAGGRGVGRPAAKDAVTDLTAYENLFRGVKSEPAIGEVSPEYLVSAEACAHIAEVLPDVRLVAILRNPIERAYSDYLMYRRDGIEELEDFEQALDAQEERHERGEATGLYLRTGFYAAQIERYLRRFGETRLRVYLYDDLVSDAASVLRDVYEFIGVDNAFEPPVGQPSNPSGIPRSRLLKAALGLRHRMPSAVRRALPTAAKGRLERVVRSNLERPPIPETARLRLADLYRDDIAALETLIGADLRDWHR